MITPRNRSTESTRARCIDGIVYKTPLPRQTDFRDYPA
jgi:hypothetical protein